MSWGVDGPFSIANGATWTDETDRTWTATGTGLTWSGFNPEFHLYYRYWTGSAWSASWASMTGVKLESFQTRRGVRSWWEGMQSNTATITVDYSDGDGSAVDGYFQRTNRVQLSVDTPIGEKQLYTGFVVDRYKTYAADGYPIMRVQLIDQVGWSGQCVHPAITDGSTQTANHLLDFVYAYGAGIDYTLDLAQLLVNEGLTQTYLIAAGNLLDTLNTYLRGELGMMWIAGDGYWRDAMRNWWYPQPDPVATIGSLDRGSGGTRTDPSEGDTGYKFPATITLFNAPVSYTDFEWTYYGGGTTSVSAADAATGARSLTDTVHLSNSADAAANLSFLAGVLYNNPVYVDAYDDRATVRFAADVTADAMNYAATADVTDFVEVAAETQSHISHRDWYPAWVMGISQEWDPYSGWWTTLDLELALAHDDAAAGGD